MSRVLRSPVQPPKKKPFPWHVIFVDLWFIAGLVVGVRLADDIQMFITLIVLFVLILITHLVLASR